MDHPIYPGTTLDAYRNLSIDQLLAFERNKDLDHIYEEQYAPVEHDLYMEWKERRDLHNLLVEEALREKREHWRGLIAVISRRWNEIQAAKKSKKRRAQGTEMDQPGTSAGTSKKAKIEPTEEPKEGKNEGNQN